MVVNDAEGGGGGPIARPEETSEATHVPVLFQAVLNGLDVQPGGRYIDATLGGGGHSAGILAASAPGGKLLGIDRDPAALKRARARLRPYGDRAVTVHGSFRHLLQVAQVNGFSAVDGILFDLGLSSLQLADPSRGFAFSKEGPLDMRFDPSAETPTAADLVNTLTEEALADLIYRYGEERQSRRIARAIVAARPIRTTRQLAEVIEGAVRGRRRIHPATLTFQALRIGVNEELEAIEEALPQAVDLLKAGGRLVVISFHSLEDRLVKHFVRRESRKCVCPPEHPICTCDHEATLKEITRKPIQPTEEEVEENPRARSAKLRVAERVGA